MIASAIHVLTAPNPSPMTLEGTNSYLIVGADGAAIAIDPGPPDETHVDAIVRLATACGARVAAIAVTHGHPDHAPGAALLRARTNAPVYAHANARFPHDRALGDGERLATRDGEIVAFDAPGHASDHLVFWHAGERALFTGDVIVGRGTVVVAPPDGDMRAYVATLRRLRDDFADARTLLCGHGPPVADARAKFDEYLAHRDARERAIVAALARGPQTIPELVARIYAETPRPLWPAAARQILAYLVALEREGRITAETLARDLEPEERAILDPDLSRLVDAASVAVARAELGFDRDVRTLERYALVDRR